MDTNSEAAPVVEDTRHPEPPSTTPTTQTRPKYGTWILVTKKAKPPAAVNNTRYTRKDNNVAATRGNQFGILTNTNEIDRTLARNNNNADKRKPKPGAKSGSKGKSPLPNNNPQAASPPQQPVNTTVSPESTRSASLAVRGRGGRSGLNRGKGRGTGRNDSASYPSPSSDLSAVHWNRQTDPRSLFHFGGAPASAEIILIHPCLLLSRHKDPGIFQP
nr:LINE-type retrotransposon LIb DNA [Ipomoea batatas]